MEGKKKDVNDGRCEMINEKLKMKIEGKKEGKESSPRGQCGFIAEVTGRSPSHDVTSLHHRL